MPKTCQVDGCSRFVFGGGFCQRHQWMRKKKVPVEKPKPRLSHVRVDIDKIATRAKIYFHRFVRQRDEHLGCISCSTGKAEQAGHYFSAAKWPSMKFNEMNTNGQCDSCNCHKNGNLLEYRKGLISRYGEAAVLALEEESRQARGVFSWEIDDLLEIIGKYKPKTNG